MIRWSRTTARRAVILRGQTPLLASLPKHQMLREELCVGLACTLDQIPDKVLDAYLGGMGQQALPQEPPHLSPPRNDIQGWYVCERHTRLEGGVGLSTHRSTKGKERICLNSLRPDRPMEEENMDRHANQQGCSTFERLGAQGRRLAFECMSGDRSETVRKEERRVDCLPQEEEGTCILLGRE